MKTLIAKSCKTERKIEKKNYPRIKVLLDNRKIKLVKEPKL